MKPIQIYSNFGEHLGAIYIPEHNVLGNKLILPISEIGLHL